MTRTMTLCAALIVAVLTVMPAEAGRWIPSSCGECAGKPVWVILLNETSGDTRAIARELTAKYGGHTRAVWPGAERKFAVEATQEEARAMLADDRVQLIDGRAERYFRSGRSRANAESGAAPESGSSFWSTGPYAYDGAGNVTSIGPNSWNGSTGWNTSDVYHYDRVNRLVSAQTTARLPGLPAPGAVQWSEAYVYDAFGNMKSKSTTKGIGGTAQSMTIVPDVSTNRISNFVDHEGITKSIAYDSAGNAKQIGSTVLTYDALNMVTSKAVESGSGSATERYLYTADDERVATIFPNGSTRYTVRGPDQKVLREYERTVAGGALAWKKDYIWRGGSLLATLAPDGKTTHYHLDHLGTPRLLTDGSGNKITMNTYLPFGGEIPDDESDGERIKFTGHERDTWTSQANEQNTLDYMHARYYNPNLGRFLSFDPGGIDLHDPQRWNRYSYVRNNPVNAVDPDGRDDLFVGEDFKFRFVPSKTGSLKPTSTSVVDETTKLNSSTTLRSRLITVETVDLQTSFSAGRFELQSRGPNNVNSTATLEVFTATSGVSGKLDSSKKGGAGEISGSVLTVSGRLEGGGSSSSPIAVTPMFCVVCGGGGGAIGFDLKTKTLSLGGMLANVLGVGLNVEVGANPDSKPQVRAKPEVTCAHCSTQ